MQGLLSRRFFSSMPCEQRSLSFMQLWLGWAGLGKVQEGLTHMSGASAGMPGMPDSLSCSVFVWFPSKCPDRFTNAAGLQGRVFQKDSPRHSSRTAYHLLMPCWSKQVMQPSPESVWEGPHRCVNTRRHNWEPLK